MKQKWFIGILGLLLLTGLSTASAHQFDKTSLDSSYNLNHYGDGPSSLLLNLTSAYNHTLNFRFYDNNRMSIMEYSVSSSNYPKEILFSSINPEIAYMNLDVNILNGLSYTVGGPDVLIPTQWNVKLVTGGSPSDPTISITAGL
jgi:hypothetical protein